MEQSVIDRVNSLRNEIEQHNYNYYVMDNPTVDDYTYDMLMQELRALEETYPELADKNSPTQRVGGEALNLFERWSIESRWEVCRMSFHSIKFRHLPNAVRRLLLLLYMW